MSNDQHDQDESSWTPFNFESNQAWGWCETKDDWLNILEHLLEAHKGETVETLTERARIATYRGSHECPPDNMNFGFRGEHDGELSLAQWAKEQNMDLSVA